MSPEPPGKRACTPDLPREFGMMSPEFLCQERGGKKAKALSNGSLMLAWAPQASLGEPLARLRTVPDSFSRSAMLDSAIPL